MKDVATRGLIQWHLAKSTVGDRVRHVVTNERGEMGSWLIVAAGLAVAAGLVVTTLGDWFTEKADAITAN